ncbi:MAG TPA: MCE family protein [Mycobacteriales bacterium]|nr:MCE family protein [Mycobacteriales bacterium]
MIKIGPPLLKLLAFAVVTILATYVLGTTIANTGYGDTDSYKAEFTDVTGLAKGDDVRVAGVRVGQVTSIKVVHRRIAQIGFTVSKDRPLPVTTHATIRYRDIVGHRYVELTQGAGSPDTIPAGGTIALANTKPALDLDVLLGGFKPLFQALSPDAVNKLSYEIIQVFQGEGGTINDLLAHTASLTSTLADRDQLIGQTVDNLNTILGTVQQREAKLGDLVGQLQSLVSGLAKDRVAIGDSLGDINSLAATTTGLLAEGRPELKSDIGELRKVATTLNGSQDVLNGVLQRLPGKLNAVTRTASYGSWFNFYLCGLQAKAGASGVAILPGGVVYTPQVDIDQARCKS